MKKITLPKLTHEEKAAVLKWLEYSSEMKKGICPFWELYSLSRVPLPFGQGRYFCAIVCHLAFPQSDIYRTCPCKIHALRSVIERAKELVK